MSIASVLNGLSLVNEPDPPSKVGNIDPEKHSTNEQKIVPHGCGVMVVPVMWIGQVYDQYTEDAPVERPGKK